MEGVILFADDHVLDNPFEKGLFDALSREKQHPVLPIVNLDLLESSIKSTSSIKALIVDWNFIKDASDLGDDLPAKNYETPFEILRDIQLFSLVYVYSETSGLEETEEGKALIKKYGNKIKFRRKDKSEERIPSEKKQILEDLTEMYQQSGNIQLPILWTQVINQAVQGIFSELNEVDKKWISDLYKTAKDDGVEPSVEVINLFQNLLSEKVVQSKPLRDSIRASVTADDVTEPDKYAKLFRTFLYSSLDTPNDPIMTGDIFKFGDGKFGILVTPECDISKVKSEYEFLTFKNNSVAEFEYLSQFNTAKKTLKGIVKEMLKRDLSQNESKQINTSLKEVESNLLQQVFNQPHQRLYVLPCFDSGDSNYKTTAQIDFRDSLEFKKVAEVNKEDRICKLNSPYIQDLRQRFLSYKGRVGVPSFPDNLRTWLLEN
ncbi:MAG: hypothetical protein R2739_09180 [Chitinophagales bacterium]